MLQIYFLTEYEGTASSRLIVYGSMLFSIISIVSNVLTHCTQREISKSTGWELVQFRVVGDSVNQRQNRKRFKGIQQEFAAILEIDKSLIGMARPMLILNGLKMEMNIYLNHTQSIDMNVEKTLQMHIGSGLIAKIIKNGWDLQSTPVCSDLTVARIVSELRKEGTVKLSMNSESRVHSQSDGIEMQMSIKSPAGSEINLSITPLEQFPKIPEPSIDSLTPGPQSPAAFGCPISPLSNAIDEGAEGISIPEITGTTIDYNDLVEDAAKFKIAV